MDQSDRAKILTERRQVHLALGGEEGVALPLGLELGGELLGGNLGVLDLTNLVLASCGNVVAHI